MGYLYAALAVLSGAIKGYCGKKTSGYTNGLKDAMLFNSVRMVFCVVIGLLVCILGGGLGGLKLQRADLLSVALSGVFSAVFVVSWLITVKSGAYVMLDVFLMLGVIVPLLGSQLLFQEQVGLRQWLGFGVLLSAALLMCSYSSAVKGRLKPAYVLVLLICGISCGLSDFSQKIFVHGNTGTPIGAFNLYSYLISFGILFAGYCLLPGDRTRGAVSGKILGYILIMSVCLFLNSFFQTLAAAHLTSAQLFPMSKSLSLILSITMAAVFFKEKINLKCVLGVILAFAGILIINL